MNKNSVKFTENPQPNIAGTIAVKPPILNKIKKWLADSKWPLIGSVWIIAFLLGYKGFSDMAGDHSSTWDIIYNTLQLFILQSGSNIIPSIVPSSIPWELQVARFLAPFMTFYTAIQTMIIILNEKLQSFRIRLLKNHVVICGMGDKGFLLARRFRELGKQVIVIEQDRNNDNIERCQEFGIMILIGNASDIGLLRIARVAKAQYLISVCGDDGANVKVAVCAQELVIGRQNKSLICIIHILNPQLYNLLREREIGSGELDKFRLEFFNVFESGARILLNEYPPFNTVVKSPGSKYHILLVGAGRMGKSLIVNAASNWRDIDISGEQIKLTLIDKDADKIKENLIFQYPKLESVCKLISRQIDVKSPQYEKADFLFDENGICSITIAYICLSDEASALSAALLLHQRAMDFHIPIVVRMMQSGGMATLLRGRDNRYRNVKIFGLFDYTCTPDLIFGCTYEILARAIHEDYIQNERQKGNTPQSNPSIVTWEALPENLRESNRDQAEHIRVKLAAIGCSIAVTTDWHVPPFQFSPEEIELIAKLEHERFVDERLHQGYRYGTVKNHHKKINPSMIPWSELSDVEKEKDRDVARNLSKLLTKARFQVYRSNING